MILHIDSGREWRGGQAQALELLKRLRPAGIEQALICPPDSPLAERARAAGVEVDPVKMRGEWDPFAPGRIAAVANRRGAKALHCHASLAHGLAWRALKRLPGVELLVTRRVDFAIGGNVLSRRKYVNPRTRFIAISTGVRDALVAGGVDADRIRIVPSGIDPDRWRNLHDRSGIREEFALPSDCLIVGAIGALVDHKDHRCLIEAASRVLQQHPETRFILVGEGELRADLEQRIRDLEVGDRVLLAGFRDDVGRFLAAFDIFAVSSRLEGLNTSLLDAMWHRIAAVGTITGGIVDAIEDGETGRLVPPRDPAALAAAIVELIEHPQLRKKYGESGRARVEARFTADAMASGVMGVYEKMGITKAPGLQPEKIANRTPTRKS